METAPNFPEAIGPAGLEEHATRLRVFAGSVAAATNARRSQRVMLLVGLLWVLNTLDLCLTIMAHRLGHMEELNPIARPLLGDTHLLILFKLSCLSMASLIFLVFRKHRATEVACWSLSTVYLTLGGVWLDYYWGL